MADLRKLDFSVDFNIKKNPLVRANLETDRLKKNMLKMGMSTNKLKRSFSTMGKTGALSISRIGAGFLAGFGRMKTFGNGLNKNVLKPIGSVTRAAAGLAKKLMFSGLIGGFGLGAIVTKSLKIAGNMEQAQISFQGLYKDAEKGNKVLRDLKKFTIMTPFEMQETLSTAQFALAMGFKNDLIPILTEAGDAAAALGKGGDAMNSIIRALGQMKGKARLSLQEFNQLTEIGVPAVDMLAKEINKTKQETTKMIEGGLIPVETALKSIRTQMRKEYAGMMIKQSKTLLGLFSSLKDILNIEIFSVLGRGIKDVIQGPLSKLIDKFTKTEDSSKKFEDTIYNIGKNIGTYFVNIVSSITKFIQKIGSDENFKKLDFSGKIVYILEKVLDKVDIWIKSKEQEIEKISSFVTTTLIDSLEKALPKFTEIGIKLGKGIIKGIAEGLLTVSLENLVKSSPVLSKKSFFVEALKIKNEEIRRKKEKEIADWEKLTAKIGRLKNITYSGFGVNIPQYYQGSTSTKSGLGLVGEKGPELVNFSGGEKVYNAAETLRLLKQNPAQTTNTTNTTNINTNQNNMNPIVNIYIDNVHTNNGINDFENKVRKIMGKVMKEVVYA